MADDLGFSLARQDKGELNKLRDEIMDKVMTWHNRSNQFFGEFDEFTQSWRVDSRVFKTGRPTQLFNSKSGETHRATETLSTLWFRMLTANDPFFEAVSKGFNPQGQVMTSEDLFAVESVIGEQLKKTQFKKKLLLWLQSLALFGTSIAEEPWTSVPFGDGKSVFESTDFQLRPLISTGFDTSVPDIDLSDYIFTVDYLTKFRIRNLSSVNEENWDRAAVEDAIKLMQQMGMDKQNTTLTTIFNRIINRKQRAGYDIKDTELNELITYHGKLDPSNRVVQAMAEATEKKGRQIDPNFKVDPRFTDFTMGIMNELSVVRGHVTQYGNWHSRFKISHYKRFEIEPLGYGVGKLGKKHQRELDLTQSRINDLLLFSLYSMWAVDRGAGLKANQLNIKPWQIIELDNIDGLKPIRPDINAIAQGLGVQGLIKEDFRAFTGAQENLQAIATQATATEASLTQAEAIRGASVHAEVIAESIRAHLETMHTNNLDNLDNDIWTALSGGNKPVRLNRFNMPRHVGFNMKVTTDKDFRPERLQRMMEALQIKSSIRQTMTPDDVPLLKEIMRALQIDPRNISEESVQQNAVERIRQAQAQQGQVSQEQAAEINGALGPQIDGVTPAQGDIPTSPIDEGGGF